jgi:hypothetical protein
MSTADHDRDRPRGDAELTERLIAAAQESDARLTQAEIDTILGVRPRRDLA